MNHEVLAKSSNGPKACTTCAKAKSRCNPGPTGETCERCHRLNKTCSAQTPAPPRKRKAPKTTRVAELEKRLEELTARVEARQPQSPAPADEGDSVVESEEPARKLRRFSFPDFRPACRRPGYAHIFASDNPEYHEQHREQYLIHQQQVAGHEHAKSKHHKGKSASQRTATDNVGDGNHRTSFASTQSSRRSPKLASSTSSSSCGASGPSSPLQSLEQRMPGSQVSRSAHWHQPASWPGDSSSGPASGTSVEDPWYYPSSDEENQFLDYFNNYLVGVFPFIVLPANMTSEKLRRDRPLLWKAIMMQGLHLDARRQVSMGDELLSSIVSAAFIKPEKSFDLLQALEILLAWFHVSTKSFQLTNLLFLMRSICVSLGFNESQEFSKQRTVANLEQMRAFMGVYYLVTMVFTTSKKPDAFMNTTYLDSCCRILEEKMEYTTDQLVVLLVRTQQLSQSISMTLAFRHTKDSLPLSLIIQSFKHEIRKLRDTIPENLADCSALKTQIHIAEILLYEAGLSEDLSAGLAPTDRLELLWECLNATRSMLEARFEKLSDGWPRSIALASFDYTYAMLVCLKLSLLQLPGWDLHLVRKELSFDKYMMIQIGLLQEFTSRRRKIDALVRGTGPIREAAVQSEFQDPFVRLHTRLAQLRVSILAELSASLPPASQQLEDTGISRQEARLVDEVITVSDSTYTVSDEAMQGLDDPFWQDWYQSNEWETSFSALLGWGADDTSGPNYASWAGDVQSH